MTKHYGFLFWSRGRFRHCSTFSSAGMNQVDREGCQVTRNSASCLQSFSHDVRRRKSDWNGSKIGVARGLSSAWPLGTPSLAPLLPHRRVQCRVAVIGRDKRAHPTLGRAVALPLCGCACGEPGAGTSDSSGDSCVAAQVVPEDKQIVRSHFENRNVRFVYPYVCSGAHRDVLFIYLLFTLFKLPPC